MRLFCFGGETYGSFGNYESKSGRYRRTAGMTGGETLRKLKKYTPTKFMAKGSHYDKAAADYVVNFIEQLRHTKGEFYNQPFALIDWQERIIRDIFGTLRSDDYRQFNTAYTAVSKF